MDEEMLQRVRRICAAIAEPEETDPKRLRATVIETDKMTAMFQDFRRGLTDAHLANQAHSVILTLVNLRDHLRKWAAHDGKDKTKVDDALRQSPEWQIIIDLSNNDKHGYPPRDGGHSRKYPKLVRVTRVMQLTTSAEEGSTNRETERNLQKINGLARLWQTIQRRVIRTGNQSSACYADQSHCC